MLSLMRLIARHFVQWPAEHSTHGVQCAMLLLHPPVALQPRAIHGIHAHKVAAALLQLEVDDVHALVGAQLQSAAQQAAWVSCDACGDTCWMLVLICEDMAAQNQE